MASFPYMQFQMYNPVEKGIDAFNMTTQAMGNMFKAQEKRAQLPYASQNAENEAKIKEMEAAIYQRMKETDIRHKQSIIQHNEFMEKNGSRIIRAIHYKEIERKRFRPHHKERQEDG